MKSDRLMIWRFAAAPETLKSFHRESPAPEWVVLVPRALNGPDIEQQIRKGSKPGQVARYETPEGDTVYMGTSQLDGIPQRIGALTRPATMAATQSKRK